MAYIESEWSNWHSFSATAYLYNKSGGNWEQIVSCIGVVVGICCTYWNHTMLSCIGVGLARRYRGETQHRTSISSTQCEGRRSIFIFSVVFWCPYCCCLGISNASLWFTFSKFCSFVDSFVFAQARWCWTLSFLRSLTGRKHQHISPNCNCRAQ